MSATSPAIAAVDRGEYAEEGFGLPPIGELFNFRPLPGTEDWGIFAVNRVALMLLFSMIVVAAIFLTAFRNPTVVPGKLQNLCEAIVGFVTGIATGAIGAEGRRFVPLLTTLFVFIFVNNLFKITPFIMLPPTGRIAIPGLLAVTVWLVYVGIGIKTHGPAYFKNVAVPPGVPVWMLPILTPIELLSVLVVRPVTLALRLFANMVAGHVLIVVTLVTIHGFLVVGLPALLSGVALVLSPLVFAFELFVISLQAYIFTLLAAVYIGDAMHAH